MEPSRFRCVRKPSREANVQSLKDGTTQLAELPAPSVVPDQLLIHAIASLVSAGIERVLVEFGKTKGLALSNERAR